jgi:hypothetical protein
LKLAPVRWYYNGMKQGTTFAQRETTVFVDDGLGMRADVAAHTAVLNLYGDKAVIPLVAHWVSNESGASPGECDVHVPPWDSVGKVEKSEGAVEHFTNYPLSWWESLDARVEEAFDCLEVIVRRRDNRQLLSCEDGKCEGDLVYVDAGASRVKWGDCIYERTPQNTLMYLREAI